MFIKCIHNLAQATSAVTVEYAFFKTFVFACYRVTTAYFMLAERFRFFKITVLFVNHPKL